MLDRTLLFIIGDFTVTHAFKLSKKVARLNLNIEKTEQTSRQSKE